MIVAHRRFGKSVLAINEGQKRVLTCPLPNPRVAYLAPSYKQAKSIIWDYAVHYSRPIPGVRINKSTLEIDYPNGGRFILLGTEDPDRLRGIYLDYAIFDEYSQQPSNIFTEVIRPALSDREGGALWIGTPKGKNQLYKIYEAATGDNWYRRILRASETGIIAPGELEDARRIMSADEYAQEYECSWVPSIRGSYWADELTEARKQGRITKVPYDPSIPVHTVWDLGISDDMAIGFFQVAGREPRMIDYFKGSGRGLEYYAAVLKQKVYNYGRHFAPHDIKVRELGTGKSRWEIARTFGIDFDVVPQLSVQDGIEAGRRMFQQAWIDEGKCDYFLDAALQYKRKWNESRGCFEDTPLHDWTSHSADVWRYFSIVYDRMTNERPAAVQYRPNITY